MDLLILPVTIGGKTFPMSIGLAKNFNTFDDRYPEVVIAESREVTAIRAFERFVKVPTYSMRPIAVSGTALSPLPCVLESIATSSSDSFHPGFDGTLGVGAVSGMVLQSDPDRARVRLLRRYEPESNDLLINLAWKDDLPSVRLDTGIEAQFLLNTGLLNSLMVTTFDKKLLESSPRRSQLLAFGESETGSLSATFIAIREVRLGKFVFSDVVARISPGDARSPSQNHLGLGLLSRFRTTIDLPNRRLYLKPRDNHPIRDDPDAVGVRFRMDDSGVFVRDLYLKGPAYLAGVRSGDRMITFNGQPVDKFSFGQIYEQMLREGKEIEFVVERTPQTTATADKDAKAAKAANGNRTKPLPERKTFRFTAKRWYQWPPVWPPYPAIKKPIPLD